MPYTNLRKLSLICLFLLTFIVTKAQIHKLYTIENGLSGSGINKIVQDCNGFLWLATENGLNKFDGDRFTIFRAGDGRKNGLTENQITDLYEDHQGNLWIGTHSGLWSFNHKNEQFKKYPVFQYNRLTYNFHVTKITESNGQIIVSTSGSGICRLHPDKGRLEADPVIRKLIPTLYFSNLCCDSRGNLFITVENEGIYIFNTKKQTLKHHTKTDGGLRENEVASLCESSTGRLFAGTTGGLYQYNYLTETFELIEKSSGMIVATLFPGKEGSLLVGTDGAGIFRLNNNGTLAAYTPSNKQSSSFINKIQSLFVDKKGNIWCGIKYQGLELIGASDNLFDNFSFGQSGATTSDICIYSVYSNNNEVWFGSDGDGLFIFDRIARQTSQPLRALPQKKILSIFEDKNQSIWIGTWNDGLLKVNKKSHTIEKQFKRDYANPQSLCSDRIWAITADHTGNLWLGTSGAGLCRMDAKTGAFSQFAAPEYGQLKPNTLCNNWVNCLLMDNDNNLWAGTADGLSKINLNTLSFTNYFRTTNGKRGVWVKSMTKTGNQIWAGTNNGILIYNGKTGKWSRIADKELSSASVCALVTDNDGNVWATATNKIYRINSKDYSTHLYSSSDGIRITEFYRYAGCRAPDGRIYFGGINGGVGFSPKTTGQEKMIEKPIFTDLLMFNKPVSVGQLSGGKPVLTANINQAEKITMAYHDCFFTIRFKIPDFISSDQVTYRYKMEGYDNNWQDLPPNKDKSATYTNLAHGEYKFVVRAESNNRFTEKSVIVEVLPPWWATIWMKAIYLLLFSLALYLYYRYNKNRAQERLDREKLNHLAEMNEMKLQFFINISHEIRTPVTLILNPLEKLLKEATDKNRDLFQMMHRNAQRLLNLVNQLMDIRKIDKGQFKLNAERVEMIGYLRNIAADFQFYTDEKRIELSVQSTYPRIFAYIDPLHFEKVMINLLSNAFRFSLPESEINIVVSVPQSTRNRLRIEVIDSGIGIDSQILDTIFDRFVQGNTPAPKDSGTGVGLHLCRQLVQLHHGTITAQNRPEGKGAILTIDIPLGRLAYDKSELSSIARQDTSVRLATVPEPETIQPDQKPVSPKTTKKQKPTIHIIEDDDEIRAYLAAELSSSYQITESITASMAIKTIFTSPPDLILSDVMMPGIDGIDFCRKVRQNHLTSHIPIILLTAKTTPESIREGLEAGADDYMMKPFNTDILKTRIAKLLEMRRNLEYHFTKEPDIEMPDIEITSHNDKLMNKINEVLVQNLSDDRLNVTFLCAEVGISRVHLNRKMKEMVNIPAQDYIRIFRLKHAANLLKENKLTVSEVAYAVGFSNPSHFSYRFRTYYGVTPTEFMEKNM